MYSKEPLAVNGTYLGATMSLELITELHCVGKCRKPVHLAIVASIHLMRTNASLDLHFLGSLGFLEINKDRKLNTREEIPINESIIPPGYCLDISYQMNVVITHVIYKRTT
eukprot:61858_1